jgi:hypothetical protein
MLIEDIFTSVLKQTPSKQKVSQRVDSEESQTGLAHANAQRGMLKEFAGLSGYGAANGRLNPVRKTGERRR